MTNSQRNADPAQSLCDFKFLVVGLVRNCESHLQADITRVRSAFSKAKQLNWLLIESDSSDQSVLVLEQLKKSVEHFDFISLGVLRNEIPSRTERIAKCRNIYLESIRNNALYQDVDYIVVCDFDGLNSLISEDSLLSCWERSDWDVCTANQRGPYYDIFALRHEHWCPSDCWAQYRFLSDYITSSEKALYASVYSKMIIIPENDPWIEVDSAFGGFAIYRKGLFNLAEYVGVSHQGEEICEHISFHLSLKRQGARIFINPRLINAAYTEHTKQLLVLNSLVRKCRGFLKDSVRILFGKQGLDKFRKVVQLLKSS